MMPRLAAMMRQRSRPDAPPPPPPPPKPKPLPETLPRYVKTDAGLRVLHRRARNLLAFRTEKGLNPFRMAQRLEMIPTNYTNAESGLRPITLRHIDALAAAFNMTPAVVLAMLDAEVGP
jgi:hypothetical protein